MAEISVNTAFVQDPDKARQYAYVPIIIPANTSEATYEFLAPAKGRVAAVNVAASVTSDATKTYTFVMTNETDTKTIVASTVYDADPVLTADTDVDLTVATASSADRVDRGDVIQFSHTGGTGSGTVAVCVAFEIF